MLFQKRHYEALAELISELPAWTTPEAVARKLATRFTGDNPKFNEERFLVASERPEEDTTIASSVSNPVSVVYNEIEAGDVWPGMIIKGHEDKGRVKDGTWQGENILRFEFEDYSREHLILPADSRVGILEEIFE